MPVENFFPTPLYYCFAVEKEKDIIDNEIQIYIDNIDKNSLVNPWLDTVKTNFRYGRYDHSINHIPSLKHFILYHAAQYINQLSLTYLPEITESWINFSEKHGFQHFHLHDGSDISGVYFFRTNTEDGELVFNHPSLANRFHKLTSKINNRISYSPEPGKLVLFPGFLEHSVFLNRTNDVRISLSFNIDLKNG